MKKILLLIAISIASASLAIAQETFKNLAVGLEVGSTGFGFELSMPVVDDHLIVKAGYNFAPIPNIKGANIETAGLNNSVAKLNQIAGLIDKSINTKFSPNPINVNAHFDCVKLLLEYYPFESSSFHLILGAFFGTSNNLATFNVSANAQTWKEFNSIKSEIEAVKEAGKKLADAVPEKHKEQLPDFVIGNPAVTIGGRTFEFRDKGNTGTIPGSFKANVVRPYFGLGFGRSVPRTNFGFQIDFGAWYHGKLSVASSNEVKSSNTAYTLTNDTTIWDKVSKFQFLPQLALRLTYKLF